MKLLVVSQYFWPESFIITDLCRTLRDQGHEVVVATGKPNYPDGQVFPGYTETGTQTELLDGTLPVHRVPMRGRRSGGALNLIRNYFSFVWSGVRWMPSLLRGQTFDAIVVFAPSPLTMAIPAMWLKRRLGGHLAIWVQDLWPESLAATGYVRNRFALSLVGVMVRWIYASADTILVPSRGFFDRVARYGAGGKTFYYANALPGDSDAATDTGESILPAELVALLRRDFCIVFAGNIGTVQAVDTLVEAARLFRDLDDVKLVFVGSGSRLDWIRERVEALGLTNVVLAGRFPMTVMPAIYREAEAVVVSLNPDEIFALTVPGKVQAYLAAGRPIIASLDGEGARIVSEAGAGLTCPAGDAVALAERVRALRAMSIEDRRQLGAAGRAYFLEHFEAGRQARRLVELLDLRIRRGRVADV